MRQASRRPAVFVLLAMMASLLGVITPTAAQAASVYDDAVQLTDSVVVAASSSSTPIDVTRRWKTYIASASGSCTSGIKTSLLNALDHGSVAVNQELNNSSSTDYRRVQVSWSESATTSMVWSGSGSSASVVFPSIYPGPPTTGGAILFMNSSGNVQVFCDVAAFGQAWSNAAGTAKGLFATNPPNYPTSPTSYAGTLIPTATPSAEYVAMGDSYSSGEGNPSFEADTATGADNCHRSPVAYPRLLDSALSLGTMAFVACSGATTSNVLSGGSAGGAWGEDPQINALSADTEVVTITIGGNDVGFTDYAIACTETLCGPETFDYDYIMGKINDSDFFDDLEATYESILTHAPNAQVYVSGYPFLAAEDSDVCGAVDLTGAWAVQDQLNEVTEDAVEDVQSTLLTTRLHYIDPNQTGSPFIGKHLCNGGASDFNGLTSPTAYSFHPNADGHEDFETVFENAIS